MPFLLMIFLTLVCLSPLDAWGQPAWIPSVGVSVLATTLVTLLPIAYAFVLSRSICGPLRRQPEQRALVLHRSERWRGLHTPLLVGCYALAVWGLGWGWAVKELFRSQPDAPLWPGSDLVLLAPFLAGLLLSWACFYDADRASHQAVQRPLALELLAALDPVRAVEAEPFGARLGYILFQLRQKLALVFLPVLLLIVQKEAELRLSGAFPDAPWLLQGLGAAAMILVFAFLPWIIRVLLGLKPMPAGPLRQRLEAATRRLGLRCSDFLLWNTRSGMANAMVLGILPWPRYVVFTDRLLEEFTPAEVEAVLGHELGHIRHRHMLTYLVFLLASMAVLLMLATSALPRLLQWLGPWTDWIGQVLDLRNPQYREALPLGAALLVYIFVVFGYLSRRCERQADVFGCRVVSCADPECRGHTADLVLTTRGDRLCPTGIRTFIRALEKVAIVNGIDRDRPGFLQWWQHGSIARRVSFLERLLCNPHEEPAFQRGVAWMKWGLFAVLGTLLVVLTATG
jgi:Zn-dependent protease with chaperone function